MKELTSTDHPSPWFFLMWMFTVISAILKILKDFSSRALRFLKYFLPLRFWGLWWPSVIFPHGLARFTSAIYGLSALCLRVYCFSLTGCLHSFPLMSFCDFSEWESLQFGYSAIFVYCDSSPIFLTGSTWSLSAISEFSISAICRTESYLSVFVISLCNDSSSACLFTGLTSLYCIWSMCECCRWLLTVLSLDTSLGLNSVWVLIGW